jgi:hypothetical protein
MTTKRSIHAINLSTAILLLGGTVGCDTPPGDDPTTTTTVTDQLSPSARTMALDNQASHEHAGLLLSGRVWFAPDAYGEIYDSLPAAETMSGDPSAIPERFVHFVVRGNSPLASETALQPRADESLDAYIARTRPGMTPTRFDLKSGELAPTGADVLLFNPSPPAATSSGDTTTVTSALDEFCPRARYDALCASTFGWVGDGSVTKWNVVDRNNERFSAFGSSAYGVMCTDRGSGTMTFFRNNTQAFVTQLFEGFADWAGLTSGWSESSKCTTKGPFGIGCLDYHYTTKYGRHTYAVQLFSTNNAHFCGDIRNHADRELDNPCRESNSCPRLR